MNSIIQLCGVALCAVCLGGVIKQLKADFFPVFATCSGVVFAGYIIYTLIPVGELIKVLEDTADLGAVFALLIKAVGISLLCGIASDICRDFGENTLANGVENAGKAAIIVLSLPVVKYLLQGAQSLAT